MTRDERTERHFRAEIRRIKAGIAAAAEREPPRESPDGGPLAALNDQCDRLLMDLARRFAGAPTR